MRGDMIELWATLIAGVVLIAIVYAFAATSCYFRWSDSGFESDYSVFSGCRIHVDGRWIPEERYRQIDE